MENYKIGGADPKRASSGSFCKTLCVYCREEIKDRELSDHIPKCTAFRSCSPLQTFGVLPFVQEISLVKNYKYRCVHCRHIISNVSDIQADHITDHILYASKDSNIIDDIIDYISTHK